MLDRQISLEDKQRLLQALLKIRTLHETDLRNLYVIELSGRLGRRLNATRYSDPQHDLWSLLNACLSVSGGLRTLVRVIRGMHGESTVIVAVERLVEELERGSLLAPADRDALQAIIARIEAPQAAAAFNVGPLVAPGSRAARDPGDWRDPMEVLRRIETLPVPGGGVPALLTFVDRLAHQAGGADSLDLHRWIDLVAGGLGMSQSMVRDLCIESRRSFDPGASGQAVELADADAGTPDIATTGAADEASDRASATVESVVAVTPPPAVSRQEEPAEQRLIWGGVPIRNPDFTGRTALLRDLNEALETKSQVSVLPQTLHGFGGVGKTQLAVEYVYRYVERYDLVWWIPAEQPSLVLGSLARLGGRLGLPESDDLQQTAVTVLDALGTTRLRWLLVFDNADQPEDLARFVPSAGGHVVVTSRNQEWGRVGDALEVDVFERGESTELLRKRGAGISPEDADLLAEKLGDLPLALEQAATWQSATGMPVAEYLQLFDEHVQELLSEGKPTSYPTTVAAFLGLAVERLRAELPAAAQLLELFAFLGAEPVSAALLRAGREAAISEPLRGALREPIHLNRAIRDLRRYGLAKVDPNGQLIQVHRLMQLVLRDGLNEQQARQSRANVQSLLASANPGDPDEQPNWSVHAEIGPHVLPANLVEAETVEARRVVLDQMRYLYLVGDHEGSRRMAEIAVRAWQAEQGPTLGPDGEFTLTATRHLANALRALGDSARARELTAQIFESLRNSPDFGEDHEYTLITANSVALDLRIAGDYRGALAVDQENVARHRRVFGDEDLYTLRARNNIAVNLRMLGDMAGALEIDQSLVHRWEQTLGPNHWQTMLCQANVARDLLALGRHEEALELQRRIMPALRDELGPRHTYVLLAARTLAIAYRRIGQYAEAVAQARDNHHTYHARLGGNHEHTLAACMTFANTLRAVGDLSEAHSFAADAVGRYRRNFGPRHPIVLAQNINLTIILRGLGDLTGARAIDEQIVADLREALGAEHTYTLRAANGLANDLALSGEPDAAREVSERTFDDFLRLRGPTHPHTLACATNVAFDRLATGEQAAGQALLDQTLAELVRVLGPEHPETVDAARGKRAECDTEPSPN